MTRYGAVRGYPDAEHTWVWAAIPFARPPVGELRWRAPQDPAPWNGVRGPRLFNGGCTQFSPLFPKSIMGSEDCLYLNVWRPQSDARGLPVYVWIHGGGNSTGSATMVPDYYGYGVANRSNMVFVSMNYRLGPFGWFTLPAFRDGASPEDASGNFGTLDIIKALQWIHENIAAFGGDPGNVTVTGESAGGFNVLSLLIAPPAKGLFHRAMSESGAAITRGIDEADARARTTLEQLLVDDGTVDDPMEAGILASEMAPERIRDYLRSKSDRVILRCYNSVILGILDNPAVLRDGTVIVADGFDALTTGDYPNKVPLIVGSNKEELKLFLFIDSSIPWQSDLYAAISRFGSERWKASGVDEVARRLSRHHDQPPVYAYEFSWGAPDEKGRSVLPFEWGRRLGAFHSLDIPFFLGTKTLDGILQSLLFTACNEEGRRALSRAMMTYVAHFALSGDPNPPGAILPAWTPWVNTPGAKKCILFDARGDRPSIVMTSRELTDGGVLASLRAELSDPLRMETLRALAASVLPASIR
jgi:para-nitrobenzyl esterase